MIRPARHEDFLEWAALCKQFLARTPYAGIEPDVEGVGKLFRQCLSSRLGCVLVAEHDGRLTGTVLGVAQEWWWCRRRVASDLILYAGNAWDLVALLRAFVDWAWAVPSVVDIVPGFSSGIDIERIGRLYERVGFTRVGSIYHMRRQS